jgi:hypothetical protein
MTARAPLAALALLSLSVPVRAGALMDAAAITVSGGSEVAVTQWRLRDPRFREIGLGKTVEARVGLKVAAGALALYVVEHERKAGRGKQAGILLGAWVGMQVVPIAINLLQGRR